VNITNSNTATFIIPAVQCMAVMRQKEFEEGEVYEDLFTGNLVVIENITDVDGDKYADICPVHGSRDGYDTRAIPEDLQAL
jgi:hypothetical protein